MTRKTLETSMQAIRKAWGPLGTGMLEACQRQLSQLLQAPATEEWLSALHREAPANRELYRDAEHGFLLLAHTEHEGLYRPPHDHGRSWVIYAVQHGEIEMGTYGRVERAGGGIELVKRNTTVVRGGQVQVYLPGDIHDTRCLSASALLFRFTERDLKKDDREAHRVTRYVQRDAAWTTGAA